MTQNRYRFCPKCGARLDALPNPPDVWVACYRCANPDCRATYLEVIDMRNVFPLQETFANIPEKLMAASAEERRKAQLALAEVDYKTVSIVPFEKILLGVGG